MPMPTEFNFTPDPAHPDISRRYQIGVLLTEAQWEVARRITSTFQKMSSQEESGADASDEGEQAADVEDIDPEARRLAMLVYLRRALLEMSSADSKFIMITCLNVCRRWDEKAGGGSWRPILVNSSGLQLRDGDLQLAEVIAIVLQVVEHNLGNFFFGGPGV